MHLLGCGTRGTCHEGVQYYTHTQKEILVRITKRIYIIYNVNNKKVIILENKQSKINNQNSTCVNVTTAPGLVVVTNKQVSLLVVLSPNENENEGCTRYKTILVKSCNIFFHVLK